MAVQGLERLAGQEAEPEERGHGRLGQVFPRPAGDLEIGVLEDVGRVDAPLQPPVEAEPDHPPQPLAVPGEQLGQGPLVPAFEAEEQVVIVAHVLVAHGAPHSNLSERRLGLSTRLRGFFLLLSPAASPGSAGSRNVYQKYRTGLWTIGPDDQTC